MRWIVEHTLVDRKIAGGMAAEDHFADRRQFAQRHSRRRDRDAGRGLDRVTVHAGADARERERAHGVRGGDFERMTDERFWETGASGKRYSRAFVLDTLEQRHAHPAEDAWETRDFHCMEIAPDNYLLTYTLLQRERMTRRATLWRRISGGWKIVYHQGTIVEDH